MAILVPITNLVVFEGAWEVLKHVWSSYLNRVFTVGQIRISVVSLVTGLIILVIALTLARSSSSLIERRLARRQHIDTGLRYTIARLIKYAVTTVGVLVALHQAFNLDLTSIAVIFTALSVGIGFGLQYIAADIASGFILLFERPIRVGDRITIGEDEGDVHSINLRTTTVYTNNRIAIIVPNSKLVSQRVINWSYGDPRARIPIPVSVADDSDVNRVTDTLIEAARGVDNVLETPEPNVQFLEFGNAALHFRLLVWSNAPRRHFQIKSDVNFRIARLFAERGIKTPTPKQELVLRSVDHDHFEGDLLPSDPRRDPRHPDFEPDNSTTDPRR
jgi:potassium efflux system protein